MDHLEKLPREIHPKDRNYLISNIFFLYTLKLFKKGLRKELDESDLYEITSNQNSKKVTDQLESKWKKLKHEGKSPSVVRLLLGTYGWYYFFLGSILLFKDILEATIPPYALGKFVGYFSPGQTELTKNDAWFYACVLIIFNFVHRIYQYNFFMMTIELAFKIRTAMSSFLYRKTLTINPDQSDAFSIGKMVTLLTKDVLTFESFVNFGNDPWITFIKVAVVCGIFYQRIGIATLAGLAIFAFVIPLQIFLGVKLAAWRLTMFKQTDSRLQVTQETLSAMRIVKMYAWEKIFESKITKARRAEIVSIFKLYCLHFLNLVIGTLTSNISFYIMMMTTISLGNNLTAEKVYFMIATFQSLSYSFSGIIPLAIFQFAEIKPVMQRTGDIINAAKLPLRDPPRDVITPRISFKSVNILIKNKSVLHDINVTLTTGLNILTGSVGGGKSVFLKSILQEYQPSQGTLQVLGTLSYASQEPWLFPSSIKQNILFGQKYEKKRYQEVLRVCALIYDFELLQDGDGTIVEDRGINLSKGQQIRINLARAVYKRSDIYLLDDSLAALDTHVSSYILNECIRNFLKNKLVILVSHNKNYFEASDKVLFVENGTMKFVGYVAEMPKYHFEEPLISPNIKILGKVASESNTTGENTRLITNSTIEKKVYQEHKQTGKVNSRVYKEYIIRGGGYVIFFLIFLIFIIAQISSSWIDKLISNWVDLEAKIANYTLANQTNVKLLEERRDTVYLYTMLTIATVVTFFGKVISVTLFSRQASIRLHNRMAKSIMNASMFFFDNNFIGNILNRFSKDLQTVDNLTDYIYNLFSLFPMLVGVIVLIATVNAVFLIPSFLFFIVLFIMRMYFLRTARSLKRLDASTRSPLIGHINATLEGLTTIRACNAEQILQDEFDHHQNLYNSAYYNLKTSMMAFSFALNVLSGFLNAALIIKFLVSDHSDVTAGDVGLALSQVYMLTGTIEWGIQQWAEVEYQLTSLERVLEYTDIKQENKQGLQLTNWPRDGEIIYQDVFLSYPNTDEQILKNINFVIKPREKIGVVGRTGAGKSSIISALFRLYDIKGRILIDGIDIKTLSLGFLRSNISIIPQDPVLFSGTVRDNIDPCHHFNDEDIWKAVELANLKILVPDLDHEIVEAGANFSIGQRQLICLARAVVKKNKIIILDEATGNMDNDTDALIHRTIRDNFANCTVFTIAHKLHTVLHSDRVMVMDKGEIIEFDTPASLMKNQNSVFNKMVAKAGLSLI